MAKIKTLDVLAFVTSLAGFTITVINGKISDKKMDEAIEQKVRECLANRNNA